VFFSSHLLDEVERVSDRLAMLVEGRIVLTGALDDIKAGHHQLTLRFDLPLSAPPALAGALSVTGAGHEWTVVCNGSRGALAESAGRLGARIVAERSPSLDEIFVARVAAKTIS